MSETDWLGRRARLSPRKTAIIDAASGARLSYAGWDQRATCMAAALRSLGVGQGDRVALLSENTQPLLDAVFACAKLGAVAQLLSVRLTVSELGPMVQGGYAPSPGNAGQASPRATPRLLLHGEGQDGTARAIAAGVPVRALDQLAARAQQALPELTPAQVTPDAPWLIVYTGGSTGVPRGALLSHRAVLANAHGTIAGWQLAEDDVAILDAPLYHTGGLNVLTTPLVHVGGTSILCRRSSPAELLALLARHRPTRLFGVPTVLLRLTAEPGWASAALPGLRFVVTGGAPAPAVLFERFAAKGLTLRLGYGLSEAGPNNFWLPDEVAERRPGAVGFPLPHVSARLIAEDGHEVLGPGAIGELLLAGPHLMSGYFDDPAAAAIDAGGWLHTGDLATRDPEGVFTIVGRRKDMFISGGENVYPGEIEAALHRHPAVVEAAVIGVPHELWGETGLAAVAARRDVRLDGYELSRFLRTQLAGFKVPSRFVFLDSLPRTGAGKVDRRALQALAPSE